MKAKAVMGFLKKYYMYLSLVSIILIALYLRFYKIDEVQEFLWDQARDAWLVRDIIHRKLVLLGPRTGIGHFHLGPLYFYLLVPFFLLSNLDPSGSNYLNILINAINIVSIYFVTSRLFSKNAGLFVSFVYAVSHYLIYLNRTPWNVSLVPCVTVFIFYFLNQIFEGNYKHIVTLGALTGLFFHLHFTGIFLFPILGVSLAFAPKKLKILKWLPLSVLAFLLFMIPTVIGNYLDSNGEYFRLKDFWNDYRQGFHLRFLLYRLPDSLLMFDTILYYSIFKQLKYILFVIFIILTYFDKNKIQKRINFLMLPWFTIPLLGFTIYSGPLSDYYFLISAPFVLLIITYLQQKALQFNYKIVFPLLVIYWGIYAYFNTADFWVKPLYGGLRKQRDDAWSELQVVGRKPYDEGNIQAYFHAIWVEDKKKYK